jgi:hypothetical protein
MRNFKIDISKCDPKQSIKYVKAQKMSKMGLIQNNVIICTLTWTNYSSLGNMSNLELEFHVGILTANKRKK